MNWELLLYIAAGLALIAVMLFVAAFFYLVHQAIKLWRESEQAERAEKSPVSVKNWADEGLFWWTRR